MQTSTQAGAAASATQAPQSPASITVTGPDGQATTLTIPSTRAQVRELLTRRETLSDQLINVSARRREIAAEVAAADGPMTRAGLEARLKLLDERILQLETDLATTGRQLASAPAELTGMAVSQSAPGDDFEEGLAIGGFSALLFMAVVLFFARRRWKSRARPHAEIDTQSGQRLERLENGMDAIAIEIERISEGQRFVTKLLSESQSLGGPAHRVREPAAIESGKSTNR